MRLYRLHQMYAVFREAAECSDSVREQRGKNEWEKDGSHSKCIYFALERKANAHRDPLRHTNWSSKESSIAEDKVTEVSGKGIVQV